jgi:type IV secretion system protein VirB11
LAVTLIARASNAPATRETPIINGELPLDGSRFVGLIPPVVDAPAFTIRKKATKKFTIAD